MTIPKRSNKAPFIRSKLITDTKKKEICKIPEKIKWPSKRGSMSSEKWWVNELEFQ